MARVEKRLRNGQVRWYARYRAPDGDQEGTTFSRRIDAERYLTGIESTKLTGTYIDPARARLTIGTWAISWLDGQAHLKPSTGGAIRRNPARACASPLGRRRLGRRLTRRSAGLGGRT